MIKSKAMILGLVGLMVTGAIFFATNRVYAQDTETHPDIVSAFAQKFGLPKDQVQSFFDEFRSQRKMHIMQNMQARFEDRLSRLVTEGKITSDQKSAILNEINSLKVKHNLDSLNTMSLTDRKKALQSFSLDLKSWAKSQGINVSLLRFGMWHHF
ncbi:MAG: hypothetical protein HY044_04440 [Candidatus Woesebacteria bacterium]|nr:MAG: hypothetical protein HY044_04440 [Candidatus Woesebacteria bacterium]